METSDYDSYGSGNRGMVISDLTDSQASSADCGAPSSNCSLNIQQQDQSQLQTEIIGAKVCDKSSSSPRTDPHCDVELHSEQELTDAHDESNKARSDYQCDPEFKDTLRRIHDDVCRTEPDVNKELQPGDILADIQDVSNSLQRIELCAHSEPQPDDILVQIHHESHIHESDYHSEPQSRNILEGVCDELNRTEPDYQSESHTDDILEEVCDESKRKKPDYSEQQSDDIMEGLQNIKYTSHEDEEDNQGQYELTELQTPDFIDESNDSHENSHNLRDDLNDSHSDSHCTHNESEEECSPRFNDTLEEIEMLLKYGVNYGEENKPPTNTLDNAENLGSKFDNADVITSDEDKKESNPLISLPEDLGMKKSYLQNFEGMNDVSRVNTIHGERPAEIKSSSNLPDGMVVEKTARHELEINADDPIVSPRKSSVTSTVSTFQPAFESTRVSSEGERHIENKPHPQFSAVLENEGKREPPPKPPRNIQGISSVKKKDNIKTPSSGLVRNTSCEKPKINLESNQSSSGKPLHLVPNSGASKQGTTLITPKRTPTIGANKETPRSRLVIGGSGPGRLGGVTPRTKPAPSPTSTPTSSRVATKSKTPGPRLYSLKRNVKSGLPPHPPSNSKQMPTLTSKLPGSQASANKHLRPEFHKIQRQPFKPGMNNIVSPIARYLKQNPPPPLVHNIKPRHRVSPGKELGEPLPVKPAKASVDKTAEVETIGARRALALNCIQQKHESPSKRKDAQVSGIHFFPFFTFTRKSFCFFVDTFIH